MIKKIKKVLFFLRQPARDVPREFNGQLLDQHREEVFALLHQSVRGMR